MPPQPSEWAARLRSIARRKDRSEPRAVARVDAIVRSHAARLAA